MVPVAYENYCLSLSFQIYGWTPEPEGVQDYVELSCRNEKDKSTVKLDRLVLMGSRV